MRALIDADIVATPIGQCVVLPPCGDRGVGYEGAHGLGCDCPSAGDVLAVVGTCPVVNDDGSHPVEHDDAVCWHCNGTGHVRRGFVRVTEVLPVEAEVAHVHYRAVVVAEPMPDGYTDVYLSSDAGVTTLTLPASPGDVVLVVELWCKICGGSGRTHEWLDIDDDKYYKATFPCINCKSTSVTIMHRDGVLGEIGDLQ